MSGWAAIDGGQSAVRVRTSSSERTFVGSGYSHGPARVDDLTGAIIGALGSALAEVGPVDVVAMGHTGLPVVEAERQRIAAALARTFGAREVRLAPDMVTAHAGALGGRAGVVIAAGTGTVCLGIDDAGTIARLDGWGYLFGDAGSSFAIGRKGIEVAMRHFDGRLEASAIFEAAVSYFGPDLRAATWDLYASSSRVDAVARFAPLVIAVAGIGDRTASDIVDEAITELATTVSAACSALVGDRPLVSYVGGLFSAGERIVAPFIDQVGLRSPGARVVPPVGDPLEGAVRIASRDPELHAPLIHVYREFQ